MAKSSPGTGNFQKLRAQESKFSQRLCFSEGDKRQTRHEDDCFHECEEFENILGMMGSGPVAGKMQLELSFSRPLLLSFCVRCYVR